MKIDIDMTIKFSHSKNYIARCDNEVVSHTIISESLPKDTLLDLVMDELFPEFKIFEGWDEDIIAHGRGILRPEGEHSKDGFVLLYQDSSLVYVVEHDGEIVLRYIGDAAMMHNRLDDIKCINYKVDNWFTSLPAR